MPSSTTTSVQSNETFTTGGFVSLVTGVLNTSSWNTGVGMNYAEVTTEVTGSPASFTILLEGSVDGGANWTTIATCSNTAGETQFTTGLIQFTSIRARCTAVSGGTAPTINVVVTTSQTPFQNTGGGTSPSQRVAVVGAVDSSQVVNRYQSLTAYGTQTAPTAAQAIVALGVFDFYYKVDVVVGFGATAESTALDNFRLKINGVAYATIPVANVANTMSQTFTFYVNPGGAVNLVVDAIANASASSVYKATITATRLT